MLSRKIHAEDQYQQWGYQQREIRKTVASQIAELFANDCRHLGRKQTQAIGTIVFCQAYGGTGRCVRIAVVVRLVDDDELVFVQRSLQMRFRCARSPAIEKLFVVREFFKRQTLDGDVHLVTS